MSASHRVTCDACQRDLTYTDNCVAYRVALDTEAIPTAPGLAAVTLAAVEPPLRGPRLHFCGRACLKRWAADNL